MKPTRFVYAALLSTIVGASSCGDRGITAPAPGLPPASGIGDRIDIFSGALLESCFTRSTETVSQTIGREGGVIAIGPDTLRIPRGALRQPVTIQAWLPLGDLVNLVVFQPEGLRFRKPASLTMGYSNCNLLTDWNLQIAQVNDDLGIIEYLKSTTDKKAKTVTGQLHHFSNYAVAW